MIRIIEKQGYIQENFVSMLPVEFVQRFNKYKVNDVIFTSPNKKSIFGCGNEKGILEMDSRYIKFQFLTTFMRFEISSISTLLQTAQTPKFQNFWITMNDKSQITFRVLT